MHSISKPPHHANFFFKGLAQEEHKVLESQLIAPQTTQLDFMKSCYPFFLTKIYIYIWGCQ